MPALTRWSLALVLLTCAVCAAQPITVDFESPTADFAEPAGGGVVEEPGEPDNHAYRITATDPHHTQLTLKGSETATDFTASLRFRILDHTGQTPGIFIYGRLDGSRFRYVNVGDDSLQAQVWHGDRGDRIDAASVRLDRSRWVRVKLLCAGDHLLAKAWNEGSPEPDWQVRGEAAGATEGRFAVGVWTSPRVPSTAQVLFDDIAWAPLNEADVTALRLNPEPRPPLDAARLPAQGVFETADLVGVATPAFAAAFDRATGELAHLVHRASGREFVAADQRRPLFEITATRPYQGQSARLSAEGFAAVEARPDGDGVRLSFAGHPSLTLAVAVTARPAADGTLRLGLSVDNGSEWAVARVAFPQFAMPAQLGDDPQADTLVLPWGEGCILPAPGNQSQTRSANYPGSACVQFTARSDGGPGVWMATLDGDGHCKEWGLRTAAGKSVETTLAHLRPEIEGADMALPYEVALGAFTGDWRAAADVYRAWAETQPWCATRLADRGDIPAFLTEGSAIVIAGIQNRQGYTGIWGDDLARLPDITAAYRERGDLAHVVAIPYGWERNGTWAGIFYLPAVPSNEAWQAINPVLEAQGDRTAFLTSGYWWVVKRQESGGWGGFDHSAELERLRDMVVIDANGEVVTEDRWADPTHWRGLSAMLCHGSDAASALLRDTFLDIARLGTPLISFDQEIGGEQRAPCYSREHGHPPGYGNWMWTDFRDLCAEILAQGKLIEPELGLFLENTSELAIPYMATYWSRQFAEVGYGGEGVRGVGLFSYLYHDYVTAIGAACVQGQGAQGTRPDAAMRVKVLANNLTRGLIPGPFMHDVPLDPNSDWHRAVSSAFFAYAQPYRHFPDYLLLGRTSPPPAVACDTVETWYWRNDPTAEPQRPGGPRVSQEPYEIPAVTAGSFTAADGTTATVLVNVTAEPRTAQVTLRRPATLYSGAREEVKSWVGAGVVEVELGGYGVGVIVEE